MVKHALLCCLCGLLWGCLDPHADPALPVTDTTVSMDMGSEADVKTLQDATEFDLAVTRDEGLEFDVDSARDEGLAFDEGLEFDVDPARDEGLTLDEGLELDVDPARDEGLALDEGLEFDIDLVRDEGIEVDQGPDAASSSCELVEGRCPRYRFIGGVVQTQRRRFVQGQRFALEVRLP